MYENAKPSMSIRHSTGVAKMLTPLHLRRRLACASGKPRLRITYSDMLLTNQGRSKFAEK